MKIAICDDCSQDIQYLKELIKESKLCTADMEFFEYSSGEELLKSDINFNAIFLDMHMGGIDGSKTAEIIRKRDAKVVLSFYSGYEAAAHKVLDSRPTKYIMKNFDKEKLTEEIELVLREMRYINNRKQIKIQYYGVVTFLELSDILYISINGKGSFVWLTDEKALQIWGSEKNNGIQALKSGKSLNNHFQELKELGFIYASKSYIVNVQNVMVLSCDEITLKGGQKLKITRGMKKSYEEEFARYWEMSYIMRRL